MVICATAVTDDCETPVLAPLQIESERMNRVDETHHDDVNTSE